MKTVDEFKIYRELADKCRNCDPFKNPQEATSLLNLLAGFLDKLIAQKEAERETSRRSDTENLTAAITDLTGIIGVLAERVGSAAPNTKKSAPKKQTAQKAFVPPTAEEVSEYCKERKNGIDPQLWIDFYTARGWILNNGKIMKDWKAAVRTWEKRDFDKSNERQDRGEHSYNLDLLAEHAMNTVPTFK